MRKLSSLLALISALLLGVTLVMAETDAAPATHATARHATSAPASLAVKPTVIGHPALNLARARQLGISVQSTQLLSAEVVTDFEWRKPP